MGMIKKLFGLEEKIRTPKQEDVIPARCTVTSEDFDITLGYEKGKFEPPQSPVTVHLLCRVTDSKPSISQMV